MKTIKEWAEENGEIPPYLKSVIDQIQDGKIERVVLKKGRMATESDFDRGVRLGVKCGNSERIKDFLKSVSGKPFKRKS